LRIYFDEKVAVKNHLVNCGFEVLKIY